MAKRNFKRQFTPGYKGIKGRMMDPHSETQPDLAIPLRTLLHKHTRGLPMDTHMNQGVYTGDEVAPVFRDLTERDEYIEQLKNRRDELQEQIDKELEEAKLKREAEGTQMDPTGHVPGGTTKPNEEKIPDAGN